ncbi:MAG: hypothetical protein IT432_02585 [Phycisphaerales bacterium]|nr:hypothetical protein [Phycisphaerales bacterium]
MGPSEKSFQQVKSILGKLDRSIDSVRQARLQPGSPSTSATSSPAPAAHAAQPVAQPQALPAPSKGVAAQTARPAFGRAQPLPRPNNSNPGGKWL